MLCCKHCKLKSTRNVLKITVILKIKAVALIPKPICIYT